MSCKSLCPQIENNYRLHCKDIEKMLKIQILHQLFLYNMITSYIALESLKIFLWYNCPPSMRYRLPDVIY